MLEVVSLFIFSVVTHILDCYVFSKLINEKFNLKLKLILLSIVFGIIDSLTIVYTGLFKLIVTNFMTFLILKIVYKKSVSKTLIGTLFTYMIYAISEAIFAILFLGIIGIKQELIFENYIGICFSNISIMLIYYNIIKVKGIQSIINKIINWYDETKEAKLAFETIIAMIVCGVLLYQVSLYKLSDTYVLLVFVILVGIIVFVIGYFKEKSSNNQLTIKYDNLLDYVKDYETEVVEKGKLIHEHKNQLAVIDGMISKNNKKLKQYVSENLEKVQELDDNIWLEKLTNLPTGGIKGLVYLKIKKMLENDIAIYVDVDSNLKNKTKWVNINNNLDDYTRILGVYLDNAIEASIESKDKQIIVEFVDHNETIEFILSNTYKGKISFDEIDNEKFSTKGNGRGYGLSLVKDIIDKNKDIEQKREMNGKFFVQKLYIKK